MKPYVFVDIDTQIDFIHDRGNLAVPGAENLRDNLKALTDFALVNEIKIIASMDANEFAETTVNIQEERGQRVIDSGVYSLVRHPMYTGFLLFLVGTNLWLGTYLSLILSILSIAIALKFRITIEEKTLINELEGYKEYSERVKTRIIPFIL